MPKRLEEEPVPRRDFLGQAGLGAAGLAIFGSIVGMARLPKPRVLPEAGNRIRIGRPEEFPEGTERVIPGRNVLVVSGSEGIKAVSLVCTHLGCIVKKTDCGFSCPCHGSQPLDDMVDRQNVIACSRLSLEAHASPDHTSLLLCGTLAR